MKRAIARAGRAHNLGALREAVQLERYLQGLRVADAAAVAGSFDLRVPARVLQFSDDVTLLRLYGGESLALGRYYFSTLDAQPHGRGLALPRENTLQALAVVRVPAGTRAIAGHIADRFGAAGGDVQFFIPEVRDFPFRSVPLARSQSRRSR